MLSEVISHYRIVSKLGHGGMGDVYLADDSILGRKVAIKLLRSGSIGDDQARKRLLREAQAAATLDHPNICAIYEIGNQQGTSFIVMQYIEGETLAARLRTSPLDLNESLKVISQVAQALEEAHSKGIVHRDIKPQNIIITPRGLVKVLDFGLAKMVTLNENSPAEETQSMLTGAGLIVGTAPYMSPEQAKSAGIDTRSDLFSLGAVLYECVTGTPAFKGASSMEICAKVIHEDPPAPSMLNTRIPAEIDRLVLKLLTKKPIGRYQTATELISDLRSVADLLTRDEHTRTRNVSSGAGVSRVSAFLNGFSLVARLARSGPRTIEGRAAHNSGGMTAPRFSLRQMLVGLTAASLPAALVWIAVWHTGQVEAPPPDSLQNAEIVRWASVPGETYSSGAFSPDGNWIAFTSSKGGSRNIWVRRTVAGEDHQSTRDEFTNESPIWSPRGDEIAFCSLTRGGQPGIWRMPMLGGPLTHLKTVTTGEANIRLVLWSKDAATIYFESKKNIFALDVKSGETSQVTELDQTRVMGGTLTISPDEKQIAFVTSEANGQWAVWFMPARGGQLKRIVAAAARIRNPVWHPYGGRVFYSMDVEGTYQVFVADVEGRKPAQITFGERDSLVVGISQDGTKVLCGASEEKADIWGVILSKAGDEFVVASDISAELWPDISPDSSTVAYQSIRNLSQGNRIEHGEIMTSAIGKPAEPFVLAKDGFLPKWSPDGRRIAFLQQKEEMYSLKTVNAGGGDEKALATGRLRLSSYSVLPYSRTEVSDFSWSPDGSKIAYCAITDGYYNLRVVSSDGTNTAEITDNKNPNQFVYCPLWSEDGRRIAYATRPNKIVTPQENIYGFWVADLEAKSAKLLAQMNTGNRLLGWFRDDLLIARYHPEQKKTSIWRLSTIDGRQSLLAELPPANLPSNYFNINLSPNRRLIAFVSHQDGKDNIWVIPTAGGAATKMTANNDPRTYFSNAAWSPDSRAIYYGKQSRYSLLSMITNFK